MPYSYENSRGQTYYLHGKEVTLQNGRTQQIFYFAREPKAGEALDALPPGREIVENPRTGLPFLKGTGAAATGTPATRSTPKGTTAAGQRASTRR
jgi:hypothetical protein